MVNPRKRSGSDAEPSTAVIEEVDSKEESGKGEPLPAKKTRYSIGTQPSPENIQALSDAQPSLMEDDPPGQNSLFTPARGTMAKVRELLGNVAPSIGVKELSPDEFTEFVNSLYSIRMEDGPSLPPLSSKWGAEKIKINPEALITAVRRSCNALPKPMMCLLKVDADFACVWHSVNNLMGWIKKVSDATLTMAGRLPSRDLDGWEVHKNNIGNCIARGRLEGKPRALELKTALDLKDVLLNLYGETDLHRHLRLPLAECIKFAQCPLRQDRVSALNALVGFCLPLIKYTIFSMTCLRLLCKRLNKDDLKPASITALQLYFHYLLLRELARNPSINTATLDFPGSPPTIVYDPLRAMHIDLADTLKKEAQIYVHETFREDILKVISS
ncbi:hypothetical protein F4811DRAFT_570878 [Daldinia bambusicola]|nr:hypothetical protein F4811DRAFT_570878 [Daldinia bambusicola]